MSQGRPYPQKEQSPKQRINEQIRIAEVLVIDENGQSRGVMPPKEAMKLADAAQLDLVEVAPDAKPPVCRILDYGKYKYQQNKKTKNPQSNQIKIKEIRLSPSIGKHDLDVRVNQAREFLNDKNKVQMTMTFTGREIAHVDEGEKRLQEAIEALQDICRIDSPPRRQGKKIQCMISPLSIPAKSAEPKPDRPRPSGDFSPRPAGPRPMGDRPAGPRPMGDRPAGPRPTGDRPSGPRPTGDRPSGPRPAGSNRFSGDRSSSRPTGDRPARPRP